MKKFEIQNTSDEKKTFGNKSPKKNGRTKASDSNAIKVSNSKGSCVKAGSLKVVKRDDNVVKDVKPRSKKTTQDAKCDVVEKKSQNEKRKSKRESSKIEKEERSFDPKIVAKNSKQIETENAEKKSELKRSSTKEAEMRTGFESNIVYKKSEENISVSRFERRKSSSKSTCKDVERKGSKSSIEKQDQKSKHKMNSSVEKQDPKNKEEQKLSAGKGMAKSKEVTKSPFANEIPKTMENEKLVRKQDLKTKDDQNGVKKRNSSVLHDDSAEKEKLRDEKRRKSLGTDATTTSVPVRESKSLKMTRSVKSTGSEELTASITTTKTTSVPVKRSRRSLKISQLQESLMIDIPASPLRKEQLIKTPDQNFLVYAPKVGLPMVDVPVVLEEDDDDTLYCICRLEYLIIIKLLFFKIY